jgi:hypothetical protein
MASIGLAGLTVEYRFDALEWGSDLRFYVSEVAPPGPRALP